MKELLNKDSGHSLVVMTAEGLQKALETVYVRAREAAVTDVNQSRGAHEESALVSKQEAMALLGKSANTLWKWSRRGYLVPIKIGGTLKYKVSDIYKILGV